MVYNEWSNSQGFANRLGTVTTKSKPTTANYNYENYENYQTPKNEYVFCVSFRADLHGQ